MTGKIRVGVVGYGNLGKSVEQLIHEQDDMELVAIFTRRNPADIESIYPHTTILQVTEADSYMQHIDVMILCGGSKTDLPSQSLEFAKKFNTVDSFDIHEKIPAYFEAVHEVAIAYGYLSILSVGWDPGLFSVQRLLGEVIFPKGDVYTFWGKGLSQGHSAAIRNVEGVVDGVQYTIPSELAIQHVRSGKALDLPEEERHERVCYVVVEEGVNRMKVEYDIKTMPHYFAPFKTTVHFISKEELKRNHHQKIHGGHVISRDRATGKTNQQLMEFSLSLMSNPAFTARVLLAYARAAYRLYKNGETGARTVFDIPPKYIAPQTPSELRRKWL